MGEPAPFTGQLYPTENAIRVSKKAERCDFMLKEAREHKQRRLRYEQSFCSERIDANKEACELKQEVLKNQPTPWWVIGLSYGAGVATVVLGAWIAGQVSK